LPSAIKITAGHFTAIVLCGPQLFGWFDPARKAYRDIPINQQVELISLIGDVGLVNGAPQIHTHGAVGLPDGEVRGGICCKPSPGRPWKCFSPPMPQRSSKDTTRKRTFSFLTRERERVVSPRLHCE